MENAVGEITFRASEDQESNGLKEIENGNHEIAPKFDPSVLTGQISVTESNVIPLVIGNGNELTQKIIPQINPPEQIVYNLQNCVKSFTGRDKVLKELHKVIEQNKEKNGNPVVVIAHKDASTTCAKLKFGGIGKSELIRKYIELHKESYAHILWINAETYTQARDCIADIAQKELTKIVKLTNQEKKLKKDQDIAEELYRIILKKPSIIVFDNARRYRHLDSQRYPHLDSEDGIGTLLPKSIPIGCVNPAIIITSRNDKNWMKKCQFFPLLGFTNDETLKFLLDQLEFDEENDDNRRLAEKIGELCDSLPLVIQQVISVIKAESKLSESHQHQDHRKSYGMAEFLRDYFDADDDKNKCNKFPTKDPGLSSSSVHKIFRVAFQKISERPHGELALEVMNLVSLLCPDCIPITFLLAFFDHELDIGTIKPALKLLEEFNLLPLSISKTGNKCFTVQRMVQEVRINMLKLDEQVKSNNNGNASSRNGLSDIIIRNSKFFTDVLKCIRAEDTFKDEILDSGRRFAEMLFKVKCHQSDSSTDFLGILMDKFLDHRKYLNALKILEKLLELQDDSDKITNLVSKAKDRLAEVLEFQRSLGGRDTDQLFQDMIDS